MQTIANYAVNGSNPSSVGGTGIGTAIAYFPNLPGASIGIAATTPSATNAKGQLSMPGGNRLNGQIFNVFASGNATPNANSNTLTITLQAQTGAVLTSPSYSTIGASGATALTTAALYYPWSLSAQLVWDSQSGILKGQFASVVNATFVTWAATTTVTGLTSAGEPPFGLVIAATFGTSGALNKANLFNFQVQA